MALAKLARLLFLTLVLVGLSTNSWAQSPNCSGANPNDGTDDTSAINLCLQNNLAVYLEPGSPGYIISDAIVIDRNGALLTSVGGKATILAHADLQRTMIWFDTAPSNVEISELILDGNHANRTTKSKCTSPDQGRNAAYHGSNLVADGDGAVIHHLDTVNAMCGSGIEVFGSDNEVYSVYSANNGDEAPGGKWADGMTIAGYGAYIHDNYIVDSTDVGLVVFTGQDCTIRYNEIEQIGAYAFAGLKVGDPHGGTANLAGSLTKDNTIYSDEDQVSFGLLVGHHPWSLSGSITDVGEVSYNTIEGAMANLVVDGIGTGTVVSNSMSNVRGTRNDLPGSCSNTVNYTAQHFGTATIQSGYSSFSFDYGC